MRNRLRQFGRKVVEIFRSRPRGTVRITFSLSILSLLLSASVVGTSSSHVKLRALDPLVRVGERSAVEVIAVATAPVNAVDITIDFDGQALDVVSVDRGGSVLTIWTEDPVIERNRVILRGGTFRRGFLGEHSIATIEFTPKRTGAASVQVGETLLLAGDGEGTPIRTVTATNAEVSIFGYDDSTDLAALPQATLERVVTDIDGNGSINLVDVSAFMGAWFNRNRLFDFDGDGRMSFKDFSILLADVFTNS